MAELRRIGHKGAALIETGNTLESFDAAVACGVDMIELDVLRTREGRFVIAHDYPDAASREPLSLSEALATFREPPLDQVEIDLDIKLPGREAELAGAIAGSGLIDRAMVSTMEISTLEALKKLQPDLRRGWTFPRVRRDWTKDRWARPVLGAGMALLRRRLPAEIAKRAQELDLHAVWIYHWLVTPEAVAAAESAGVELYAWTADDAERVGALRAMGVHGICTNDPRLLVPAS